MTKKELFQIYFPELNWSEFALSNFWVEVCLNDYYKEVYVEESTSNINSLSQQNEIYTDNPGPVG